MVSWTFISLFLLLLNLLKFGEVQIVIIYFSLPVLARFYLSLEFLYFTSNAFHSINCTRERRALRN